MNVVDASAVVAVLFDDPGRDEIERKLMASGNVMSAATWWSLGSSSRRRRVRAGTLLLGELMARAEIDVVPVDREVAEEAMVGWRRFGKGRHPAALNLGNTFSYALARHLGHPLLFVGNDFSKTDVAVA